MYGTTDIDDVGVVMKQFEKAALRLHCVLCGDTMFIMEPGRYVCIGCHLRQSIVAQCNEQFFEDGDLLVKEIRITLEKAREDVNLMREFIAELKK